MEYISENNDFTKDIKENALKMRNTLLHPKFFKTLSFALDVLFILKDVSLQLQNESGSIIGLEVIRVKLMTSKENSKFKRNICYTYWKMPNVTKMIGIKYVPQKI